MDRSIFKLTKSDILPITIVCILTIVGAKLSVSVFEIPFTLQTVVIYTSALILSPIAAWLSQVSYLIIGLFLPVFAKDGFGVDYIFLGTTSGYLLSFPIIAFVISLLNQKSKTLFQSWLSVQVGSLILFTFGVILLHLAIESNSFIDTAQKGWFKLIPVDQLKILVSVGLYAIFKRIKP